MINKTYRLKFRKSHFGENGLDTASIAFEAPRLFSALFLESLKLGGEEFANQLLEMVKNGNIIFSNAFPYTKIEKNIPEYYLPKPIFSKKREENDDAAEDANENRRKAKTLKKVNFIPFSEYDMYLQGRADVDKLSEGLKNFAMTSLDTKAKIARWAGENTKRYDVSGVFYNQNDSMNTPCKKEFGLYLISVFETEKARECFEVLLQSLAISGLGGKRTAGYGGFEILENDDSINESLLKMIKTEKEQPFQTSQYILLSTALPRDDELEKSLENASYLVKRRGGFIYSTTDEMLRKNDIFMLSAGSSFENIFGGDVYDVQPENYSHPVYTYGKGIFLEVEKND